MRSAAAHSGPSGDSELPLSVNRSDWTAAAAASIIVFFGCLMPVPARPQAGSAAYYVGPEVCAGCHQTEAERWKNSHHALAMEKAAPATVLGDFRRLGRKFRRYEHVFACGRQVRGADRWSRRSGFDRRRRTIADAGSARRASRPASSRERVGQVFTCKVIGRCGIGVGSFAMRAHSKPPARKRTPIEFDVKSCSRRKVAPK